MDEILNAFNAFVSGLFKQNVFSKEDNGLFL